VASGTVVHGKLHVTQPQRFVLQDELLVWPDGPVTVTVERQHATRSAQANAYYWGVVVKLLSEHTGSTPDEMHDILKMRFLSKEVALRRQNGEVVAEFVIGGSTAQLNTVEFYDYVEQIRQFAFDELDVDIPPADPEWREKVSELRRVREGERHGIETGIESSDGISEH
jgi:hypothetical protein